MYAAFTPAPRSIHNAMTSANQLLYCSGVAATRFSPTTVSVGIPICMSVPQANFIVKTLQAAMFPHVFFVQNLDSN